jgi:hypothetical protein
MASDVQDALSTRLPQIVPAHDARVAGFGTEWQVDSPNENTVRDVSDVYRHLLRVTMRFNLVTGSGVHISVATMCSGTDAPIVGLREIQEAFACSGYGAGLSFNHVFSAEIEPFKQAFIRRNARPSGHIFRNIVEMATNEEAYVQIHINVS